MAVGVAVQRLVGDGDLAVVIPSRIERGVFELHGGFVALYRAVRVLPFGGEECVVVEDERAGVWQEEKLSVAECVVAAFL